VRQAKAITVLGICPGLGSLAYVCATWRQGFVDGDLIDHDILRGSKPATGDSFERLVKKARVHSLILSVVLERNSPSIVVVAPHAGKETTEPIAASAFEVGRLCGDYHIVPVCFASKEDMFGIFPDGADTKGIIAQRIQGGVPGSRNKLLAYAALATIAGFERVSMAAGAAGIVL
jgi:hypothetical protein